MDYLLHKRLIAKVAVAVLLIVVYKYGKIKNMMEQNVIFGQQEYAYMQCYVVVFHFKEKIVILYMQIY